MSVTQCGLASIPFDFIPSSSSILGSHGPSHTHLLLSSSTPGSLLRQGLGGGCFPGPECASFLYKHGLYFKCLLRCHVLMSSTQTSLLKPATHPSSSQSASLCSPFTPSPQPHYLPTHCIISLLFYHLLYVSSHKNTSSEEAGVLVLSTDNTAST